MRRYTQTEIGGAIGTAAIATKSPIQMKGELRIRYGVLESPSTPIPEAGAGKECRGVPRPQGLKSCSPHYSGVGQ